MATMHVNVDIDVLREFVRIAMAESTELGIIPVNDVVDQSAAVTDPGDENFKPTNRAELRVALHALCNSIDDDRVQDTYERIMKSLDTKDEDDMAQKTDTKTEAMIRRAVRKHLQEAFSTKPKTLGPVVGDLPPVTKVPPNVHGGEYARSIDKHTKKLKSIMKANTLDDFGGATEDVEAETPEKRKFSTVSDVEGASFQEIAQELGFSVAGAKQAVDKALAKAQWLGAMQEEDPEDLEIITLTSMNDYIKMLAGSGELTPADIQLMKDHPEIVRDLDGFREFLDRALRKARKGSELESPLGESKKVAKGSIIITLKKAK